MNFFDKILDLVFPPKCTHCGKVGAFICDGCQSQIIPIRLQNCAICNKLSADGRTCPRCHQKFVPRAVLVTGYYKDPILKSAIQALKYQKLSALAPTLAQRLVLEIENSNLNFDVIAPVPISKKRLVWRGFNQSELVAKYLARKLDKPFFGGLIKVKNTETQVGLTRKDRQQNLSQAFKCPNNPMVKGKRVLLIDDVITTGSTLNECAKVLKKAGVKSISAVVIAKE